MARSPLYNSKSDRVMDSLAILLSIFVLTVTLYPLLYVVAISFSSVDALNKGQVFLYPIGININAYKMVFRHPMLLRTYLNTIFYTVAGTAYSLVLTVLGAYVCAKRGLIGRNLLTFLITFTMLFSGGLIPTFMTVNSLGMIDTIWAILIPCAVSAWNLIIIRTAMMAVPAGLEESAFIDGANDFHVLWHIHLPLSMASIATIALFYAVGRWNDYFTGLIYLNRKELYPVQLVIRSLLVSLDDALNQVNAQAGSEALRFSPLAFRGAVVVVTSLPILCVYPFVQKYFVKGVMIGAIKG